MMRDVGARQFSVAAVAIALSLASCLWSEQLLAQAAVVAPPPASGSAAVSGTSSTALAQADLPSSEPDLAWDLLHRRFATWNGPTGGLYLFDARQLEPGAVRVQLGFDAFVGSNYLQDYEDHHDHIELTDQALALNVSATRGLEFYATLGNRSTTQTKPEHRTLDALGDVSIGGRLGTRLGRLFDVGADLRASLINGNGGGGFDWGATSVALRGALSMDLQQLSRPIPLVARLNVGYVLDNSAVSIKDIEDQRYKALDTTKSKADETTHLVTRFERLAMNINRLDRLVFGAGVELPLQLAPHFFLHPILEWQMGLPVNRQNYDCPYVAANKSSGKSSTDEDSCYERDASSIPMNLAFAVRVVPPVRGLSALLGVDVGISGSNMFVRDLAPNVPWRILFGFSYDYDARPSETAPVAVTTAVAQAPVAAPAAVTGRVQGVVVSTTGPAIADARVKFLDLKLTTLATGEDGHFSSEPLPPGAVALEVSHPDYETARCTAVIPQAGGDAPVTCTLAPKPLVGRIQGQVIEAGGGPLSAARVIATSAAPAAGAGAASQASRLPVAGVSSGLVLTDARGNFAIENLTPGEYVLRIEAGGFFIRQVNLTVEGRGTTPFSAALTRKPIAPTIVFSGDTIEAPALTYATETSTQLTAAGSAAIAEIADVLLSRPELYIQIQGFGVDPSIAMARAMSIKQRLVEAGVPESHIEAVGGGTKKFRFLLHR